MLPLALLLLALLVFWLARRARSASGLPAGRVVYADTGGWARTEQPLYSDRLGLTGKPDYLVAQRRGGLAPVEVKSGAAPVGGPHPGHIYQLAAYCALVAETTGRRPAHGLIKYADQTLQVPYTRALEADLLRLLRAIQSDRAAADVPRSHTHPARCRGCGVASVCAQSLAEADP
ncbi:MAG: Dna2/Cas4 domain-containing protein [Anaerolineales bacterium]|nr:Dna2/Cas4 domain-containing protein [Anaerolineales bacterium]